MEKRATLQKKMRKILRIGMGTTIYGILVNHFVDDFEVFFLAGFMVLLVDVTVFFALEYLRKKCKEEEEQEEKNKKF